MLYNIYNYTKNDVEAIATLHFDFKKKYAYNFDAEYYNTLANVNETFVSFLNNKLIDNDFSCFIAKNNEGEIIGYITGFIMFRAPIYTLDKLGYLSNLYVCTSFRKLGIAQLLFSSLQEWFITKNVDFIEVSHNTADNYAEGFYKKLGFNNLTMHLIKSIK